jgi:SAM-dependent methyltransferase
MSLGLNVATKKKISEHVQAYFGDKIQKHGPCPQGVDWNGQESQEIRFQQLLKLLDPTLFTFSINDLGCGYGALLEYMINKKITCNYTGYDLSPKMIQCANEYWSTRNSPVMYNFINDSVLHEADYSVASGIFNAKAQIENADWLSYIFETLDAMHQNSRKGFAFNILTIYSDADRMRNDLYYADPCVIFHHCKQHYAKNIALLHDYKLYEFTIIVKKD